MTPYMMGLHMELAQPNNNVAISSGRGTELGSSAKTDLKSKGIQLHEGCFYSLINKWEFPTPHPTRFLDKSPNYSWAFWFFTDTHILRMVTALLVSLKFFLM